jgi:Cu+-exporting ATPase
VATDLVCGMIVDENSAPAKTTYEGAEYYFCAAYCKETFDREPQKFIHNTVQWGETTDPVCGMSVKIPHAAAMSVYKGRLIYFCSSSCKEKFDDSPELFLKAEDAKRRASIMPIEGLKKAELPITGMSCASCVARIEKGLSKMSGIVDVKVNFDTEKATINFDPSRVHLGDFVSAIKDLGMKPALKKSHYLSAGCPVPRA